MSEYKIFECMFVLLTNSTEDGWDVSEKRKEYIIAKTSQEVVEQMDRRYEVPNTQFIGYVHTIPVAGIDTRGFIDYYDKRQYEI